MSEQINEPDVSHVVPSFEALDLDELDLAAFEEAEGLGDAVPEPEEPGPLAVVPALPRDEALAEVERLERELEVLADLRSAAEAEHADALAALDRQRAELEVDHRARVAELDARTAERRRARSIHLRDHELVPVAWQLNGGSKFKASRLWCPVCERTHHGVPIEEVMLLHGQLLVTSPAPAWVQRMYEHHRGRCMAIAKSTGQRCQAKTELWTCDQHDRATDLVLSVPKAFADVSIKEVVEMPADPAQTVPDEDLEVAL